MDRAEAALLRRVRMTVADAASARGELHLDGWPLLLVDRIAGCVRVNDLRSSAMFTHGVALPSAVGHLSLRVGAVAHELYLLVGDVAAVSSSRGSMVFTPMFGSSSRPRVGFCSNARCATGR